MDGLKKSDAVDRSGRFFEGAGPYQSDPEGKSAESHPVMRTSLQVFVLNDAITFFCN
jgi:hypothetical protein